MLTSPSRYVAGAYPCFAEVMARGGERIPTDQNEYDLTADRYTEYLRRCAGKIIHTLRGTYKTDADMLDQLAVIGIPKRLRKASLVLIRGTLPPATEYVTAAERNAQPFEFGAKYRAAS
jgi:DNA relaxase NicK